MMAAALGWVRTRWSFQTHLSCPGGGRVVGGGGVGQAFEWELQKGGK